MTKFTIQSDIRRSDALIILRALNVACQGVQQTFPMTKDVRHIKSNNNNPAIKGNLKVQQKKTLINMITPLEIPLSKRH